MGWLRSWREKRRLRYRALFEYHDGVRARRADPAIIWRHLVNHPKFDLETMMPEAHANHEPEVSVAVEVLCEIFDVQPWNDDIQSGLTTWEILDLVRQFEEYLLLLKKSTSPAQTPLLHSAFMPPDGLPQNSHTTLDENTNFDSASSSTPIELNDAEASTPSEPLPTA